MSGEAETTKAELYTAQVELVRVAAERNVLERRVNEFTSWAHQTTARMREQERILAELRCQLAEIQEAATGQLAERRVRPGLSQTTLQRTVTGIEAFRSQFDHDLTLHRSQRAWKVMLCFRKAYTLMIREGWPGRLRLARSILGLGGGAGESLENYEPQFPDIASYIPARVLASSANGSLAEEQSSQAMQSGADPLSRHDVIILPVFEFDFRFQRPQHLAEQFAARGHRVFWISPSRTLPLSSERPFELSELRANLWEVRLRARHSDIYRGSLDPEETRTGLACLHELYRDCLIGSACVLVQLPFWRRIALALRDSFGARIVYDCMDDWETMPDLSEFTRSEEKELARECDALVVTSSALSAKYQDRGLSPELVRNGVDFELLSSAQPAGRLKQISRPIVTYCGAIAEWFNYDLLYEVARSRPQYSFVLIGSLGLEEEVSGQRIARLKKLRNVHLLGHKPYAQIPSYLAESDACIIPFVLNQVTKATDPVKLYEYLSQGKPVVATAMGELANCAGLMHIASDASDFARKLDVAVTEQGEELKARRIKFASENTWDHRVRALETILNGAFPMVSVVIVTHNSAGYTAPCLDSLRRNTAYPSYEVIVVDNGSQDGTADLAEQYAAQDSRVRVLRQAGNTGFAAGNNLGIRNAKGEYLVLLNMDTIVTPGWVERLIRHLHRDPSVGMVIPVTNWAGNEVKIDAPYTNLHEMEQFSLRLARENIGIALDLRVGPLFCALVRRTVWEKVGELDERFEVGMFEDDDFSYRMANAGYRIVSAEDCLVHHFGQGAFSKLPPQEYQEIFDRNRRRFEQKWGASWIPHKYRSGVTAESRRFTPAEFVQAERGAD